MQANEEKVVNVSFLWLQLHYYFWKVSLRTKEVEDYVFEKQSRDDADLHITNAITKPLLATYEMHQGMSP